MKKDALPVGSVNINVRMQYTASTKNTKRCCAMTQNVSTVSGVSFSPAGALKIVKSDCSLRENANWSNETVKEIYKQANSGGVLLSSMGNPKPLPVYWDKILINASQVTNPSIDPLREPMETRVYLGKKPSKIQRRKDGSLDCTLPPQLELSMPLLLPALRPRSLRRSCFPP